MSKEPTYQPNEADLQVATLQSKAEQLHTMNAGVVNAQVALSNSLKQRNKFLYDRDGIHDVAISVKKYVKGAFGFQSAVYNQISGLKFRKAA